MESDSALMEKIRNAFSEKAYSNGQLDRKYLSALVFNNKQKLDLLNSIVHPFTIKDGNAWMERQSTPYAIKEAALIFESGSQSDYDRIIGVFAPPALRINRTIKRDHVDREKVMGRIENQMDESIKMKLCDHVLFNDEQQLLIPQVIQLHQLFVGLSN